MIFKKYAKAKKIPGLTKILNKWFTINQAPSSIRKCGLTHRLVSIASDPNRAKFATTWALAGQNLKRRSRYVILRPKTTIHKK